MLIPELYTVFKISQASATKCLEVINKAFEFVQVLCKKTGWGAQNKSNMFSVSLPLTAPTKHAAVPEISKMLQLSWLGILYLIYLR